MRLFFLQAVLLFSLFTLSVLANGQSFKPETTDSPAVALDTTIGDNLPIGDSLRIRENVISGLDSYLRMQDERNRKRKKEATIRIGIGVAFLAVLIAGLLRKKKQ